MKFRDLIAVLILIAFAVYSVWRGMQTVASVAIIGFLMVIYKRQMVLLRNILTNLVKNTKHAKLGGIELQIGDKTIETGRMQAFTTLAQILLSTMSSDEIGLLAEIARVDQFEMKDSYRIRLRGLRDKGLINHDNETMEKATVVRITDTGKALINELTNNTVNDSAAMLSEE